MRKLFLLITIFAICLSIVGCNNNNTNSTDKTSETQAITTVKPVEYTGDTATLSEEWVDVDDYINNEYFSIIETGEFIGNPTDVTNIIHKVFAKQGGTISATMTMYDEEDSIIGTFSDSIVLTAGQNTYFRYMPETEVLANAAEIHVSYLYDNKGLTSDRQAIKLVDYRTEEGTVYLNVEQLSDSFDPWSSFKILFYKDNFIVYAQGGSFGSYTKELTKKGDTAEIAVWAFDIDFDDIEFIYEP